MNPYRIACQGKYIHGIDHILYGKKRKPKRVIPQPIYVSPDRLTCWSRDSSTQSCKRGEELELSVHFTFSVLLVDLTSSQVEADILTCYVRAVTGGTENNIDALFHLVSL